MSNHTHYWSATDRSRTQTTYACMTCGNRYTAKAIIWEHNNTREYLQPTPPGYIAV